MATVKNSLFTWKEVERSPDITRFKHMLEGLNDKKLISALYKERKGRRNDYPIEAMWNSLLAMITFAHPTTASFIRELKRNGELRDACGFDPLKGEEGVPDKHAYKRFYKKIFKYQNLIEKIFHNNVENLKNIIQDFGKNLAVDGKAIKSYRKNDTEADIGVKKEAIPDGEIKTGEHTMNWFGYKLHMLCDANYELPIGFKVTKASEHEGKQMRVLLKECAERHPNIIERADTLLGDRGYDCGEDKQYIHEKYKIKPVIPSRDLDKKMKMKPIDERKSDTIYYSSTGDVCCKMNPFKEKNEYVSMEYHGYERERGTLKFRCPAAAYGIKCENQSTCRGSVKDKGFGRIVRIPIDKDPRVFMPIHRHSKKFKREYNKRTSVERLFSRIDNMYGFERHVIYGIKRMEIKVMLTMIVMTSTAIGYIEIGKKEKIRSYFQAA